MSQTVLVADDSQTIRKIVEMALKGTTYQVLGVGSAQDAMEAARQVPSVILLDYFMPDGSGYDVCRALKANSQTSGIPVVMLGGTYKGFDQDAARQSGADGVLMKPFKTDDLIEAIASAVDGTSAVAQPAQPAAQPASPSEPTPAPAPASQPSITPESQPRIPSTPPPAGSQPRIATPDVNASTRQAATQAPAPAQPSATASTAGSGLAATGITRSEVEKMIRDEVKNAVREELPGLLRNIMGEVFQQKVLPKLVAHAEGKVQQIVSQQLGGKIQEQVRYELERLLAEE